FTNPLSTGDKVILVHLSPLVFQLNYETRVFDNPISSLKLETFGSNGTELMVFGDGILLNRAIDYTSTVFQLDFTSPVPANLRLALGKPLQGQQESVTGLTSVAVPLN